MKKGITEGTVKKEGKMKITKKEERILTRYKMKDKVLLKAVKKDELVITLEEYVKFLSKYISDHVVYLHIHGFVVKAADIKKGKAFRAKIAKLKEGIYK